MPEIFESRRGEFVVSADPNRLDFNVIHDFLARAHSLPFGLYEGSRQIGVARVLSDFAIFAYLMDVFIHEEYRGRGLGQWLLESVMAHPDLRDVRRWMLATRDAHELYARFGFHPVDDPRLWMERIKPFPEEG
jgi:GNAT superfamily N-acetyltransferase